MKIVKPLLDQLKRSKDDIQENDYFTLGHMIKYNVYLVSKSIIFSALLSKHPDEKLTHEELVKLVEQTEAAMKELDLVAKSN